MNTLNTKPDSNEGGRPAAAGPEGVFWQRGQGTPEGVDERAPNNHHIQNNLVEAAQKAASAANAGERPVDQGEHDQGPEARAAKVVEQCGVGIGTLRQQAGALGLTR